MKYTAEMLTGKSRIHLSHLPCPLSANHFLQIDCLKAFQALQKSALENGFNLQPASTFRDFQRQQFIWNSKFLGERKVHDDLGKSIDFMGLSDWEKIQAILRWSALPGASRHHWGTEIDFFDPDLLPENQKLQLEPWEYEKGGYFAELSGFLQEKLPHFDFVLPFIDIPNEKKIGREPWHISYVPIAEQAQARFTPEILTSSWTNDYIEGKETLLENLSLIWLEFML